MKRLEKDACVSVSQDGLRKISGSEEPLGLRLWLQGVGTAPWSMIIEPQRLSRKDSSHFKAILKPF